MRGLWVAALAKAVSVFLRKLARIALQVFHETTGTMFLFFAAAGAMTVWREWRKGSAQWLVGLTICFTLMMAAFSLAAFRSARRAR